MKNVALVKSIIEDTRQIITKGESTVDNPVDKCPLWSQGLAIALRWKSIPAIPFAQDDYRIKKDCKGSTKGHCITIAKLDEGWVAVDLSSAQIKGLPPEKIWEGHSLEELCQVVDRDLPAFMPYEKGLDEKFEAAAAKSTEKDKREGRYTRFEQSINSGEVKG